MKVDPSNPTPTPTPTDPLGYRSPAADRAAREKVSLAALVLRPLLVISPLLIVPLLLLASRERPREAGSNVICASNLRNIGQALKLYADANNGYYPASLSLAFAHCQLPVSEAFCPNHNSPIPTTLPYHLLDARSDYLYLAAGLTTSAPSDIILAHERPALRGPHDQSRVNVLFADGRVEFLYIPELQKALESSHTQRQLWERRPQGTPR